MDYANADEQIILTPFFFHRSFTIDFRGLGLMSMSPSWLVMMTLVYFPPEFNMISHNTVHVLQSETLDFFLF